MLDYRQNPGAGWFRSVFDFMGHSNTMRRRVILAAGTAAGTALLSYFGMNVRRKMKKVKEVVKKDKQLDMALEDSMDCSDATAKY